MDIHPVSTRLAAQVYTLLARLWLAPYFKTLSSFYGEGMGGEPDLLSRETVHRLIGALNRMFQGLQREIEAFVLAHIAGMPVLLVGPHGSGKTRLTKAFYSMLCLDGRP
ncbi:MAG: hypothetical protein DRJ67_10770, partial [Thermoprotei archaeon]